jgi:hypothetical protein
MITDVSYYHFMIIPFWYIKDPGKSCFPGSNENAYESETILSDDYFSGIDMISMYPDHIGASR